MIETTTEQDRAQSTRRLFISDGHTEFEITVTLRQDIALPDEAIDLQPTGALPQNGALADALVQLAAALNRHRPGLTLPHSTSFPAAPIHAFCHEG